MGLSPQREDELVVQILRDQVGIDSRSLRPVLRLSALGLVNSAWRNTQVEDWHAEGRLHGGDMLRVSSHMSWRLGSAAVALACPDGDRAGCPSPFLDEITFDDFRRLGGRIYLWIQVGACRPVRSCAMWHERTCLSWRTTRTRN